MNRYPRHNHLLAEVVRRIALIVESRQLQDFGVFAGFSTCRYNAVSRVFAALETRAKPLRRASL
jgi:hypothetical protein